MEIANFIQYSSPEDKEIREYTQQELDLSENLSSSQKQPEFATYKSSMASSGSRKVAVMPGGGGLRQQEYPSFENLENCSSPQSLQLRRDTQQMQSQSQQLHSEPQDRLLSNQFNNINESMFSITDTNEGTGRAQSQQFTNPPFSQSQERQSLLEQLSHMRMELERLQTENQDLSAKLNHSRNIMVKEYLQGEPRKQGISNSSSSSSQFQFNNHQHDAKEKIFQLNQDIQQLLYNNNKLSEELAARETLVGKQKQQLDHLASKVTQLQQDKLAAAQAASSVRRNDDLMIDQKMRQSELRNKQLEAELLEKKKQFGQYQMEFNSLLDKAHKETEQWKSKCQDLEKLNSAKLTRQAVSVSDLEREVASEKEKNHYLEQRLENLKNEISYMEIAMKERTNQMEQIQLTLEGEREKLRIKCDHLEKMEKMLKSRDLPQPVQVISNSSNESDQVLNQVVQDYIQFQLDYRTSPLFPSCSDIHTAGFLKAAHGIDVEQEKLVRAQNNPIARAMSLSSIFSLILIELENLLKYAHRTTQKLAASETEKQLQQRNLQETHCRVNLFNAVQQKNSDEFRLEILALQKRNDELQNQISQISTKQHTQVAQTAAIITSRKPTETNFQRLYDGARDFYDKLIEMFCA